MKRLLLICVISLLFVSGWGHVLAAAFCPNMQAMPGCPMQTGKSTSSHETMEMGEMGDMQMTPNDTNSEVNALEQPMVSCSHCMKRSELPPAPVIASRAVELSKQQLGALLQQAIKAITPQTSSFAPPVASRQHAPPGATTARYVLINVYLI